MALAVLGAGDSLDSVVRSVVGALMIGVEAGTDDSLDDSDFDGGSESDGKLERSSGFSRRMTFLLLDDLAPDLEEAVEVAWDIL